MNRRAVLAAVGSVVGSGCLRLTDDATTSRASTSDGEPTTVATTQGGTTETRTENPTTAKPELVREWQVGVGGEGIAVDDETVFVQTGGVVTAVDGTAGAKRWEVSLGVPTGGAKPFAFGEDLVFTAGDGKVFAIEPSGPTVRWQRETQFNEVRDLLVHEGRLYAVDFERQEGNTPAGLYAFDTDGGTVAWSAEYRSDSEDRWPRELAAVGDVLYVGMYQGLFEYDLATGRKRTHETEDGTVVEHNPTLAGGFCRREDGLLWLVGSVRGPDTLQKYDPAADEVRWEADVHSTPRAGPVLTDDSVVVGSNSGFFAYDRSDGAKRWEKLTREWPYMTTTVGDVVVGSDRSRTMYGMNPAGEVLFERGVEKTYHSVASLEDTLVVATQNLTGHSFR
ncbi:PQQ-binding-like beta-propeller repeat protein [Halorubellus sp. PRR65]|uniref:PQQ-like beta-propeller repeat protein n=1 Tax=Halorubellus sp. PRR65 TaxID=3098148 RepID=UPI002B258648|nr:PQQ-binding-like beta-propeller repeat protein [Halorubellus sp. PRR65]